MQRKLFGAILISAGIAACATKPAANLADNTPLSPTAVIEQQIVSNGIKGFFPFESNGRHYVRANMRRDESIFKGTGTFSSYLVGTRYDTEITRVDRKLKWSLDTNKGEYTECPLKGCQKPSKQPAAKQSEAKAPQAEHESGCTMHIAHTRFTVKPTGQKKPINGFDTDEYQVAWVVELRDNAKGKTTSSLNLDIWTTPKTRAIRDALEVEEDYARTYDRAVASGPVKPQLLPADAAKLITAYLASTLKPGDLNAFLEAGKQMERIKGYPISTRLAWNMDGNACAPRETGKTQDKSSIPSSAGDLVSGLTGMFAKKKSEDAMKDAEGEPILSFTFEVKTLKIEPQHDSLFSVPKNYKLVSKL